MQPLLTVREAAQILKVKEATVRDWVRNGNLAASKAGKAWRISETDVQEMLRKNAASKGRRA